MTLPQGLLGEAGLDAGSKVLAYSNGNGRIVLRREADAIESLLQDGPL
ncbi:hypothetical protein ACF1DY_06275 [Streptomyces albus]